MKRGGLKIILGIIIAIFILVLFSKIMACTSKKEYVFTKQVVLTNGTRITIEWNDEEGAVKEK
jgi:hypothetical protein